MTRDEYFDKLDANFRRAAALLERKNHDYAGDGDPFKNFRLCEMFGVSAEKGILIRITDKLSRIGNLLERPGAVVDEKIEDTLIDTINYCNILLVKLGENNGNN